MRMLHIYSNDVWKSYGLRLLSEILSLYEKTACFCLGFDDKANERVRCYIECLNLRNWLKRSAWCDAVCNLVYESSFLAGETRILLIHDLERLTCFQKHSRSVSYILNGLLLFIAIIHYQNKRQTNTKVKDSVTKTFYFKNQQSFHFFC